MKWQKTSLPVVCLSTRASTFDAGAAHAKGAASRHSAADKRIIILQAIVLRVKDELKWYYRLL
jgi:hypothetical protein